MNDVPRQTLCKLIAQFGPALCSDPRRCKGLLQDHCPSHKREVFVLASALEEQVVAELVAGLGGRAWETVAGRLARRLVDNRAMDPNFAYWAVESWALALGLTTPAATAGATSALLSVRRGRSVDQNKSQRSRPPRVKRAPAPLTPPQPHSADALLAQLAYVIVNEAGASAYSTSRVGREELPDVGATLRSSISIGRRLQDPLSELVKIEPQNVGVGLYELDVNPKQLKDTLEAVISSCVNFVGVDLNTASVSLLRHVSGLNQATARRIVDHRKQHGPFTDREQLKQVEGIGPATFTQAAGFLKISGGDNPLDRTWIHPESYSVAAKLLDKIGYTPDSVLDKHRLSELRTKLTELPVPELAKELEVGEFRLRDIIEALGRPERDPRQDLLKPIFKKAVLKIEDLKAGMELSASDGGRMGRSVGGGN